MNCHFAGISCPGRRGGSESGFYGRCLVLQQSSTFEKLLGRSCSDPNLKVQNTMKSTLPTETPIKRFIKAMQF